MRASGRRVGDLGAPGGIAGDHGIGIDKQFAGAGDHGRFVSFAGGDKALVEGIESRVPTPGDAGGGVERTAQPAAAAGDMPLALWRPLS